MRRYVVALVLLFVAVEIGSSEASPERQEREDPIVMKPNPLVAMQGVSTGGKRPAFIPIRADDEKEAGEEKSKMPEGWYHLSEPLSDSVVFSPRPDKVRESRK